MDERGETASPAPFLEPQQRLSGNTNSNIKDIVSFDNEKEKKRQVFPEAKAPFFSRITYHWLSGLIGLANRRQRQEDILKSGNPCLEPSDMYLPDTPMQADRVSMQFEASWEKALRSNPSSPMIPALWDAFGWKFMFGGILKVFADATGLIGPFLISKFIKLLRITIDKDNNPVKVPPEQLAEARSQCFWIAVLVFALQMFNTLAINGYFRETMAVGVRARAALSDAIYGKVLRVSGRARSSLSSGYVVNLLAGDCARVDVLSGFLHYMWSGPFQMFVIMVLLWRMIYGYAFVGLALLLLFIPIQARIMLMLGTLRRTASRLSDERIKAMLEFIRGIRVIKLYAWEEEPLSRIIGLRSAEATILRQSQMLRAGFSTMAISVPVLASCTTFVLYRVVGGHELSADVVFPALAYFNLLRMPLTLLPMVSNMYVDARVALRRIEAFLLLEERPALTRPDQPSLGKIAGGDHEHRDHGVGIALNGTFTWQTITIKTGSRGKAKKQTRALQQAALAFNASRRCPPSSHSSASASANHPNVSVEKSNDHSQVLLTTPRVGGEMDALSGAGGKLTPPLLSPVSSITPQNTQHPPLLTTDSEHSGGGSGKKRQFTLKVDHWSVPRGALVGVAGPTGSGKSSLLLAILGEMTRVDSDTPEHSSPAVDANNNPSDYCINSGGGGNVVAYCSQSTWLQHGTIKDNILFDAARDFDPEHYAACIRAACLDTDLARMPAGDATRLGESGVNLSGGQRARLAMARLLYARPTLALLDDPLSAVDAHVSKELFQRAIVEALAGTTRLLVTHNSWALAQCDRVVHMSNGRITHQGHHSVGSHLSPLKNHHANSSASDEEECDDGTPSPKSPPKNADKKVGGEEDNNGTVVQAPAGEDLEQRAHGAVDWAVYTEYASFGGGWKYVSGVIATTALTQAFRVIGDYWLVAWTERKWSGTLSESHYVFGYVGSGVLQAAATFTAGTVFAVCGLRASVELHRRALHAVARSPVAFFEVTPSGRILNRFAKDLDLVDNALTESLRSLSVNLGGCLATLAVITWQNPAMLVPLAALMWAFYLTQARYRVAMRELKRIEAVTRSPLLVLLGETLAGLTTVRAFGREERFRARFWRAMDTNSAALYTLVVMQRWLAVRLETISNTLILVAMLVAAGLCLTVSLTLESGANILGMSPATVGMSLTYCLLLTNMLSWTVRQAADSEANIIGSERLGEYANRLPSEAPLRTSLVPPAGWPTAGHITFAGVNMWYEKPSTGKPSATARIPALRDISLDILPGQRVGVVGRTGAGKSSLLAALFRLVDSYEGLISIDGVDIKAMGLADLRSRISIIPQEPLLFNGSIRTNLDPNGNSPDADLWLALERAHLKPTVETMEGGLDALLSASGDGLSVGQRQLLCLARALLRNSRVLVLDEATANVDYSTDQQIQASIRKHFAHATILTIAHRIDTIADYDRVIVMEAGRVVEEGPPGELAKRPGSIFAAYSSAWQKQQQDDEKHAQ